VRIIAARGIRRSSQPKAEVEISQVLERLDRVEDQLDMVLERRPAGGSTA